MILLDVLPMPYENPIALVSAVAFFFTFVALAIGTYYLLKQKAPRAAGLVTVILFLVAIMGSMMSMVLVNAFTYHPHYRPLPIPTPEI